MLWIPNNVAVLLSRCASYLSIPVGRPGMRLHTGSTFKWYEPVEASISFMRPHQPRSADAHVHCHAQVVLNDIHIDIMDYIAPATCADVQFRSMWAEFEWENKARAAANDQGYAVLCGVGIILCTSSASIRLAAWFQLPWTVPYLADPHTLCAHCFCMVGKKLSWKVLTATCKRCGCPSDGWLRAGGGEHGDHGRERVLGPHRGGHQHEVPDAA